MSNECDLRAACEVAARFGLRLPTESLEALGNRGGFSGARLFRLTTGTGQLCLRAWPPGYSSPQRLMRIHTLMQRARDAGLGFVPALHRSTTGASLTEYAGRFWEMTTWMPGRADFHGRPSVRRLEAACQALAGIHLAWGLDA